jgi:hypothetical protein
MHEELISQCLNGERDPDCRMCPASPNRGGKCCFSVNHEYGHPDCSACVLQQDCAQLTHNAQRQAPRVIYPSAAAQNRTIPVYTSVAPGTQTNTYRTPQPSKSHTVRPGEPLLETRPHSPAPLQFDPNDTLFKRFVKVSAYGCWEGFFEMALHFIRTRRPE